MTVTCPLCGTNFDFTCGNCAAHDFKMFDTPDGYCHKTPTPDCYFMCRECVRDMNRKAKMELIADAVRKVESKKQKPDDENDEPLDEDD